MKIKIKVTLNKFISKSLHRELLEMKSIACITIYCILFGLSASTAPATSGYSRVKELESQIDDLSRLIQLYEESNSRFQRQTATNNVINENRKHALLLFLLYVN